MGQYIPLQGADSIPVLVTVDGIERIGELEAWRSDDHGRWEGFVRYVAPINGGAYSGLHLGWFDADDIKRDEQPAADPATDADA